MKTTAAVLRSASGPFAIEEIDLPALAPDEALIRVAGVGMCHTDLLAREGGPRARPPIVLGHEASGVVEDVGAGVLGIRRGDHAIASFLSCDRCPNCRHGQPAYCEDFFSLNLDGAPQGSRLATDRHGHPVATRWFGQSTFATHAIVSARALVPIDPDLPLEPLGPLGCGILTGASSVLRALKVPPRSTFAVFGSGSVGIAAVMAARLVGASQIIAVDADPGRLEVARALGADDTIVPEEGMLEEQIRDIVPEGVQNCLDTTGAPAVIAAAVAALRVTGCCGLVGVQRGSLRLPSSALSAGKTVTGILVGDAVPRVTIPQLLDYWRQGRFPFDKLIAQYKLSEINQAERDCAAGTTIKAVLVPDA